MKGYIDVPLQIAGVEVAHPFLVVSGLAFPILIGMDVLRPHSAGMLLGESVPFQLNMRISDMSRTAHLSRSKYLERFLDCMHDRSDINSGAICYFRSSSSPSIVARISDSCGRSSRFSSHQVRDARLYLQCAHRSMAFTASLS